MAVYNWRFVKLPGDEGPTIDILVDGGAVMMLPAEDLDQLYLLVKEVRLALGGYVTDDDPLTHHTLQNDDLLDIEHGVVHKEQLTIERAYHLRWNGARRPELDVPPQSHNCLEADNLEFKGVYGAPGVGQAWECKDCGKEWAKVGDSLYDPNDQQHILTIEDVR